MRILTRSRLKKAALTVVTLVAMFGCAEVILRFFGYGDYIIYVPDDALLWRPAPNQHGKTVAGHEAITINGQGFRYPIDLPKTDRNEVRVFAFGDSVTMGWGVDDRSHYAAVLERMLAKSTSPRTVRVISAGVNAYPQTLCVWLFKELLAEGYQMDVAIMAYSFNHGYEPLTREVGEARRRFLRQVRLKSVLRRSAVYNIVIEDFLRSAVYYRLRDRLIAGGWDVQAENQRTLDEFLTASLDSMRLEAERHGVRLIFVLLGTKNQQPEDLSDYQILFRDFARRRGIPLVDIVSRIATEDQDVLFLEHVHPTALGHRIIASELLPVVEAAIHDESGTFGGSE